MLITLLVAWDDDRLIGCQGGLPWHIPEDLKLFQERTKGNTVIFGLKTYNSLPKKPLAGRVNIVLALPWEDVEIPNLLPKNTSLSVASSIQDAIDISKFNYPENEIFICGGASIYKQALELDLVSRMLVSVIPGSHQGDVYFPEFSGMWLKAIVEEYDDFVVEEWVKDQK